MPTSAEQIQGGGDGSDWSEQGPVSAGVLEVPVEPQLRQFRLIQLQLREPVRHRHRLCRLSGVEQS